MAYETAETYAAGSRQRREGLTAAAAKYRQLYERYQPLLAGFYARLGEARCAGSWATRSRRWPRWTRYSSSRMIRNHSAC